MPLLIDGYNLLNESGIFSRGGRGHTLQRARTALLEVLAEALPPDQRPRTVVVFDAKDAPPGLPREETFRGIKIYFAARHEEADDLIEELIRAETSPRQLTVVSSDHRLQRAARRRRAEAVDSDRWFAELSREASRRESETEMDDRKPVLPLTDDAVAEWVKEFGDFPVARDAATPPDADEPEEGDPPDETHHTAPHDEAIEDSWNPFPPGYAEDLLDDEEP